MKVDKIVLNQYRKLIKKSSESVLKVDKNDLNQN